MCNITPHEECYMNLSRKKLKRCFGYDNTQKGEADNLVPKPMFETIKDNLFYRVQKHTRILKNVEFDPPDSLVVKINSLWVVKFRQILSAMILRTT